MLPGPSLYPSLEPRLTWPGGQSAWPGREAATLQLCPPSVGHHHCLQGVVQGCQHPHPVAKVQQVLPGLANTQMTLLATTHCWSVPASDLVCGVEQPGDEGLGQQGEGEEGDQPPVDQVAPAHCHTSTPLGKACTLLLYSVLCTLLLYSAALLAMLCTSALLLCTAALHCCSALLCTVQD